MKVLTKNMSGVFIFSTTPRKARLLLKEKKAVIESKDPFTIRLLFPASECGLKDSKERSNDNTSVLSGINDNNYNYDRGIPMCDKATKISANESNRNVLNTDAISKVANNENNIDSNEDKCTYYISKETDPKVVLRSILSPELSVKTYNCLLASYKNTNKIEYEKYYSRYPVIYIQQDYKLQYWWLQNKPKSISMYFKELELNTNPKDDSIKAEYIYLLVWEDANNEITKQTLSLTVYNYPKEEDISNSIGIFIASLLYTKIEFVDVYFYNSDFMLHNMIKGKDDTEKENNSKKNDSIDSKVFDENRNVVCNFKPELSDLYFKPFVHLYHMEHCGTVSFVMRFEREVLYKILDGFDVVSFMNKDSLGKLPFHGIQLLKKELFYDKYKDEDFVSKEYKNIPPDKFAKSLIKVAKELNKNLIALRSFDLPKNEIYLVDEYFRELSICCKNNDISLMFGYISKNISTIFKKFSDIITTSMYDAWY